MGIFDYQSGNNQGILIHVLGMNPVIQNILFIVCYCLYYNLHVNRNTKSNISTIVNFTELTALARTKM